MPRRARRRSATGVYHIILRGINRQIIFEEENDFKTFKSILYHYKMESDFQLLAYCLMHNHVHLLIKEETEDIAVIMKKIEVTFVKWYNQKYQRIGYLFQERYKSEPVETEEYLLTVFRYIHQNPMNAGLECRTGEKYPWTSFWAYKRDTSAMIDTELIREYFSDKKEMLTFLRSTNPEFCMEYYTARFLQDEDALGEIKSLTGCKSIADFQKLNIQDRDRFLAGLIFMGFTMNQLSRLTGTSIYTIGKIKNQQQFK